MSLPHKLLALGLLVLPPLAIVLLLPPLELHLARNALVQATAEREGLHAGTLARADRGHFLLDTLRMERDGLQLTCHDVLLAPSRRSLIVGGRPLRDVRVERCAILERGTAAQPDPAGPEGPGEGGPSATPEERLRALLSQLARYSPRYGLATLEGYPLQQIPGRIDGLEASFPTASGSGARVQATLVPEPTPSWPLHLAAPIPFELYAGAALRIDLPEGVALATSAMAEEIVALRVGGVELLQETLELRELALHLPGSDEAAALELFLVRVQRVPEGRAQVRVHGLHLREPAARALLARLVDAGLLPARLTEVVGAEESVRRELGSGWRTAQQVLHDAGRIEVALSWLGHASPAEAAETEVGAPPLPDAAPASRRERQLQQAARSREVREGIRQVLLRLDRNLRAMPDHLAHLDPARWPVDLRLIDLQVSVGEHRVHIDELELDGRQGLLLQGEMDGRPLRVQAGGADALLEVESGGWHLGGLVPLVHAGQVSGRFTLRVGEDDTLVLDAEPMLHELVLMHDALAAQAVGPMDLALPLRAELGADGALRLTVEPQVGAVHGHLEVTLSGLDEQDTLEVRANLGEGVACADLWGALPAGLAPELAEARLRWEGRFIPQALLTYRLGTPHSLRLRASAPGSTCRVVAMAAHLDPARLNRADFVHRVQEGTERDDIRVGPGTSDWVPITALPSYIPALMYLSEEIAFFRNRWISIPLLNRALRMNIERGYYVYGGSTVTQQLVKNLWLTREKTLSRKIEEAVIVWALEERVSKVRVLEMYLNVIEYGPDIFGIQAAARHYFGVDAWELTPLEAAFLAALKPSPWAGEGWRRRGRTPERGWFPERLALLLERLVTYGEHIEASEVAHFAPWVLHWPTDANAGSGDPAHPPRAFRTPRPEGARTWYFFPEDPEHRMGMFLVVPQPSERYADPPEDAPRRPGTR